MASRITTICALLILLSAVSVAEIRPIVYEREGDEVSFKGSCLYFLDKFDLGIDDIASREFANDYDKSWYYEEGHIWIKFQLSNQSRIDEFILTMDQWQEATVFVKKGSSAWERIVTGTLMPVDQRPEAMHRLLSVPVRLQPGDTATFLLKARNFHPTIRYYSDVYDFSSKIEWDTAKSVRSRYILNQVLIFFVLGISFALSVYNGYILFKNPRWDVFYLIAYIVVTAIFLANIHGVTTIYIFKSFTSFELQLGLILVHISSILIGLYMKTYLGVKGWDVQNVLLIGMIIFMLISFGLSMYLQRSMWYEGRRIIEGSVIVITLLIAVVRKQKGAYFLIAAFVLALAGRYISESMAVIEFSSFLIGDVPYMIGFLLQMTFFTAGSSVTLISTERELQSAMEDKQELLENQNQQLNEMVEKRTKELEVANAQISERNKALEQTIFQLKDTQKQLIANEKMASIGKLTAGLAHELNNPLNFIGGSIDPVRKDLLDLHKLLPPEKEESIFLVNEIESLLNNIQIGSTRASSVVNKLVEITPSLENNTSVPISLDEITGQLLEDLRTKHPAIQFKSKIPKDLMITGVFDEIHHLIAYVLSNSIDAVKEVEKPVIRLVANVISNIVVLKITDNGAGISEGIVNQIFDPFFTTKDPGEGIGLGLFISQTIVRKHGGTIKVESRPGAGTTVTIELPQNYN